MTYPGNPSISPEVQQRIRSTFEQTLGLAERGSRQEAALGCDFILQLDPRFRPARNLLDRLKATDGDVQVDDLRAELAGRSREAQEAEAARLFDPDTDPGLASGGPAAGGLSEAGEPDGGDLDLDSELPDLGDLDDLPELPDLAPPDLAPPASAPAAAGGLRSEMEEALAQRRFDHVLELAQAHVEDVQRDPELGRLAATAADRREAAPYVDRFLTGARTARAAGNAAEAQALEEKARSLDPSHPALQGAEAASAAGEDAGTRPGGTPAPAAAPATPDPDELPELPSLGEPAGEPEMDFDFGSGDDEGDRRIQELLEEGQEASERGDHQGAIDAWSRIFLIDIDHQEASERIEQARRLKNEQERKVEEVHQEALDAAERGDTDAAREGLEKVLALAPAHATAAEELERLRSGQRLAPAAAAPAPARPAPGVPEPPPEPSAADLKEEILVPPEPGEERPSEEPVPAHKRTLVATRRTPPHFLYIGAAVLLAVLVGGYLLYQNRDSLFPNADQIPAEMVEADPVARATRLHEAGKTAMAINLLRRLPPAAPRYEEAQALISQWEAADQPDSVPVPVETAEEGPDQRLAAVVERAAVAAAAGENLRARALLDEAEAMGPLPPGSESLVAEVDAAVADLSRHLELLEAGDYRRALPQLWLLHDADPANPDLRHLIASAYYNLAVRSLQQGDAEAAAEHLQEATTMEPEDEQLQRQLDFARTYQTRDKDLLYRIYVKYLPSR